MASLQETIEAAVVIDPDEYPQGAAAIGSLVAIEDLASGQTTAIPARQRTRPRQRRHDHRRLPDGTSTHRSKTRRRPHRRTAKCTHQTHPTRRRHRRHTYPAQPIAA